MSTVGVTNSTILMGRMEYVCFKAETRKQRWPVFVSSFFACWATLNTVKGIQYAWMRVRECGCMSLPARCTTRLHHVCGNWKLKIWGNNGSKTTGPSNGFLNQIFFSRNRWLWMCFILGYTETLAEETATQNHQILTVIHAQRKTEFGILPDLYGECQVDGSIHGGTSALPAKTYQQLGVFVCMGGRVRVWVYIDRYTNLHTCRHTQCIYLHILYTYTSIHTCACVWVSWCLCVLVHPLPRVPSLKTTKIPRMCKCAVSNLQVKSVCSGRPTNEVHEFITFQWSF